MYFGFVLKKKKRPMFRHGTIMVINDKKFCKTNVILHLFNAKSDSKFDDCFALFIAVCVIHYRRMLTTFILQQSFF